jgi:hypothetical protein
MGKRNRESMDRPFKVILPKHPTCSICKQDLVSFPKDIYKSDLRKIVDLRRTAHLRLHLEQLTGKFPLKKSDSQMTKEIHILLNQTNIQKLRSIKCIK